MDCEFELMNMMNRWTIYTVKFCIIIKKHETEFMHIDNGGSGKCPLILDDDMKNYALSVALLTD